MKRIGRFHTWLFRRTGGRIGGRVDGLDVLLLTVRGRRSGLPRTQPLPYFHDSQHPGERLVLLASFGGNERDPDWCRNLDEDPEVKVRLKQASGKGSARRAAGEERTRLWREITEEHPRYLAYQDKTRREIPVVVIELAALQIGSVPPRH
ncbi:MAG: hypothetical protein CL910_06355 [Deltaproteobacteria bacterium]|nr:hypothetical protein [Deltaproteobacteria bacterium]